MFLWLCFIFFVIIQINKDMKSLLHVQKWSSIASWRRFMGVISLIQKHTLFNKKIYHSLRSAYGHNWGSLFRLVGDPLGRLYYLQLHLSFPLTSPPQSPTKPTTTANNKYFMLNKIYQRWIFVSSPTHSFWKRKLD